MRRTGAEALHPALNPHCGKANMAAPARIFTIFHAMRSKYFTMFHAKRLFLADCRFAVTAVLPPTKLI